MLYVLRKNQKFLFLIVAVAVVVAFSVFPDSSSTSNRFEKGGGKGINVLGTRVTPEEIEGIQNSGPILQSLGSGYNFNDPMFQQLMRMSSLAARTAPLDEKETAAINDFVVNTALCRVLARQLGISVSQAEVDERLKQLPKFQTNGTFDPVAFKTYIDAFGGEGGVRRTAIYQTVGDTILFDKLFALVGQACPPSSTEIDQSYIDEYQRITASILSFSKKDFENQEITEEEMKTYFDDPGNKSKLLSEEKRACRYVLIAKPKDEELKDLDEVKKAEKLKEHKRLAASLSERLVAEDRGARTFEEIASELGLEVQSVEPFARLAIPEALQGKPQVVQLVFALVEIGATEVKDAGPEGYYAVELTALEKPQPMTFETAREKITKTLKEKKQAEKFTEFVKETRGKLKTAVEAGKSLAEAATEAGAPAPRELAPFGRRKPLADEPNFHAIQQEAARTDSGALSEPVATADGQVLVFVTKKELPKDPKMEDQKKALASQRHSAGQQPSGNPVFNAWFTRMRDLTDAGLTKK